jgi:hypothetical protein
MVEIFTGFFNLAGALEGLPDRFASVQTPQGAGDGRGTGRPVLGTDRAELARRSRNI